MSETQTPTGRLDRIFVSFFIFNLISIFSINSLAKTVEKVEKGVPPPIVIGIGESERIRVDSGQNAHFSDGSIVRSRVSGREIIFTGRRVGRAQLRVFGGPTESDRTVYVVDRRTARGLSELITKLNGMRGISLDERALPSVVVKGELLRIQDWRALSKLAKERDLEWVFRPTLSPEMARALRSVMEADLAEIQAQPYPLTLSPQRITLSVPDPNPGKGSGLTPDQKRHVSTLGIEVLTVNGIAALEPLVRTRIVIAEIRKNQARQLGIRLPTSAEAEILPGWDFPVSGLKARIEAMEEVGDGRILAMPTLLCRSGGEAKFLAGGEIPIKVISTKSSHVDWKKYGILLSVQPIADAQGRMRLSLTTEVSTIDGAATADGVPGLLVNRVETQFNLARSQTIVLSGLMKRQESQAAAGLPFFRSLPILGRLFESRSFNDGVTELIAFVTPEVVSPETGTL